MDILNGDAGRTIRALGAAVLLFLPGCPGTSGTAAVDLPAALHNAGVDRYRGELPASVTTSGAWEVNTFSATSTARCLTGTSFIVSVRTGDPRKVILYLEGGGACWDYASCYPLSLARNDAAPPLSANPGFLKDDPRNPLNGWSVVYASYCDGSLWWGDNDITYTSDDGVDSRPTFHRGLANLSAAVTLARQYFPNPDILLVAGSSAGGYGTIMGYMVARLAFPSTPLAVMNDSGPGLVPHSPGEAAAWKSSWRYERNFPPSTGCPQCASQRVYYMGWALDNDPALRVGVFSSYNDLVLSFYLQYNPGDFKTALLNTSGAIHAARPGRFQRYFVTGAEHTILGMATFYTSSISGVVFHEWMDGLVTPGRAWPDLLE